MHAPILVQVISSVNSFRDCGNYEYPTTLHIRYTIPVLKLYVKRTKVLGLTVPKSYVHKVPKRFNYMHVYKLYGGSMKDLSIRYAMSIRNGEGSH